MFSSILRRLVAKENKYYTNYSCCYSANVKVKEQWDLVSSVCLERKPRITKDLDEIELKYSQTLAQVEYELSFKSDHEVRKIKDKLYAEEMKKKDSFIEEIPLQTAQEFEDSCKKEFEQFKFAPRTTNADNQNDTTSTERKLSSSLMLVTKQKLGKNSYWVLPQGILQEGETMRQAAERVLQQICGPNLQTKFLGNAPCGFYKYRYPKNLNINQSVGMKIFFFKAQLINGNVCKDSCQDFKWLAQNELDILQEDYYRSIKMFLIDDEDVDYSKS